MRVLHLITVMGRGGIETWLLSILEEVKRRDCEMNICCKGPRVGDLAPAAREAGAEILHCPMGLYLPGFVARLSEVVREGEYDLVHNHLSAHAGLGTAAARRAGVPVIAGFHNTHFEPQAWIRLSGIHLLRSIYTRWSVPYALRHSECVTGCSRGVLDSLARRYGSFGDGGEVVNYGTEIIPPATDEERRALRRDRGWTDDAPVIIHVGRFVPQKNHEGLLAIFAEVVERLPETGLMLVGDGRLRQDTEDQVAEMGLAERVAFLGPRDDVPDLMARSDLLVFPSRWEGLPMVLLEAAAAGLPVVAYRVGGVTNAVVEGENAILHE
jgi:glycosyltransferase involved in cell wall biosynthesis